MSHTQHIEGIGTFTWRIPRTMRDEIKIAAEVSRLTEGVSTPSQWLSAVSEMIGALKVLSVESTEGWDIDAMDPLDPDTYKKISEVYGALRAAEERFRRGRGKERQAHGQGDGRNDRPVVPETVQPPA